MIGFVRSLLANRWLVISVKLAVVAIVIGIVGGALREAWLDLSQRELHINYTYAVLSGLIYMAAQLPMAWYWRQTLLALEQPAPWLAANIAFFLSQIGKYVPGKAMVVLIRTERMQRSGGSKRLIAAAVFIETLTIMAIGGVIAAVLISIVHKDDEDPTTRLWLIGLSVFLAVGCLIPTWPPVVRRILAMLSSSKQNMILRVDDLNYWLMLKGWGVALVTWTGLGLSVLFAAMAVEATEGIASQHLTLWILAAALPSVAGFLSLLPAGIVVRDGLLLMILVPYLGEANALATTLASRLIWIMSEAVTCVILLTVVDPARKAALKRAGDDQGSNN